MEQEIERKIFLIENYNDKFIMEEEIKRYINKLRKDFPSAIVTREFYEGRNILIRATQINNKHNENKKEDIENELEQQEVRIKELGINGLGENVDRNIKNGKSREKEISHNSGGERER